MSQATSVHYLSKQGDTVSGICFDYYGTTKGGVVEAVLEANTGLADYGSVLPCALLITLPVSAPAVVATTINLWD